MSKLGRIGTTLGAAALAFIIVAQNPSDDAALIKNDDTPTMAGDKVDLSWLMFDVKINDADGDTSFSGIEINTEYLILPPSIDGLIKNTKIPQPEAPGLNK